jgi:hypothetical protein
VPGNTPDEVPGEGDPPDGGGTPPGQTDPDDDADDDGDADTPEPEKVVICHYPAGDITKGNTIEIDADSVADHLAHGDTLGACSEQPDDNPTNTPLPAPTNTPAPAPTNTPVPAPTSTPEPAPTAEEKVLVCHYPSGDDTKGVTIEIDADSLAGHLAHGDTLGACP